MITHSKPTIEASDIAAIKKVLAYKQIASGQLAEKFGSELKKFFKAKQVVLTPSGTEALVEALKLLKIENTDEVIIPAYVCSNVARAVLIAGAKPVVADINRHDYNISYESVAKKITKNTKAVIVPHIFGNPVVDIKKFLKLGVVVIEDVAQAIGGVCQGRRLGSFSDMTVCSFYATKMITTGEGGALAIRRPDLRKRFDVNKYLYKMPDFQAALGLSQLRKVNSFIRCRQRLAGRYAKGLKNIQGCLISKPKGSAFYRCIIEIEQSRLHRFTTQMRKQGIAVSHFTDLALTYLNLGGKLYPNASQAMKKVVSLPLYPSLTGRDISDIIKCTKKLLPRLRI